MRFLQITLTLLCLIVFQSLEATTVEPKSKITDVTVFSYGAMVSRSIKLDNLSGKQKLILKGLPLDIDPKSVVLEASNNIEIISIKTKTDFSNNTDSLLNETQLIRAKIPALQDSLNYYNSLSQVLQTEKKLINQHKNFQDEKGTTQVDELIKASQFYRQRIKEIELELLDKQNRIKYWSNQKDALNNKIRLIETEKLKMENQIFINLNITKKEKQKLVVKYYTKAASWYPFYDLKVDKLDQGLNLYRKAFVNQKTGEDWDNVNLTLSNANPNQKNNLPVLHPYIISNSKQNSNNHYHTSPGTGIIVGPDGYPLIGANITTRNTNQVTITDIDGSFYLDNAVGKVISVSFIGYKTKNVVLKKGNNIIQLEEANLLDEVVVRNDNMTGFYMDGLRVGSTQSGLAKKEKTSERKALKQTKIEAINSVEYHIKMPYSIPSNNEEIDVLLAIDNIDCDFEYHAVPTRSNHAFLMAMIPDWHELDLLKGNVNLFLSNTFKGTSHINPKSSKDTLSISIGIDPEIIIEREQKKDLSSKKFLSRKIEEELVYEITVKNNKSMPASIKIMDQIPVSTNDNIDIKLLEKSGASLDEERGFVIWHLNLNEGESIINRLSYSVKYPIDYRIEL